jgi:hypothetical protein
MWESASQGQQETGRVEVPLNLFELDAALAERVAEHHVDHDDRQQRYPQPRGPLADSHQERIDEPGQGGFRQFHLASRCVLAGFQ